MARQLAEWASAPIPIATVMRRGGFDAAHIPPARQDWFGAFLEQSRSDREEAALAMGRIDAGCDEALLRIVRSMFESGVASYVLGAANQAYDADAKDRRRGWDFGARLQLEELPRSGVSEILRDVVGTRDPSSWRAFPHWFTTRGDLDVALPWLRASAARWLPRYSPEGSVDTSLLDDPNRRVRLVTAMNCAEAGYPPTAALIHVLQDGASDPAWIWSSDEHYDFFWSGQHAAIERLLEIAPRHPWARARCRALIGAELAGLAGTAPPYADCTQRRIARLEGALSRAEQA